MRREYPWSFQGDLQPTRQLPAKTHAVIFRNSLGGQANAVGDISERNALFKLYINWEQALQIKLVVPASASPALAKRTLLSTTDGNRIQNVESCVFLASFHQGGHKILRLWLFSFQKMTVVLLLSVVREIQPFRTT